MQMTNYLFFENRAAEAFDFYAKCLNGKIAMKVTFADMQGPTDLPPEMQVLIAHVRLEAGDAVLMGSDWCTPPGGEAYPGIHGNAVQVAVDTPEQAERLFAALSEGGTMTMPIAETAWAHRFGMLTDRFGAMWMVNCHKPEPAHIDAT